VCLRAASGNRVARLHMSLNGVACVEADEPEILGDLDGDP